MRVHPKSLPSRHKTANSKEKASIGQEEWLRVNGTSTEQRISVLCQGLGKPWVPCLTSAANLTERAYKDLLSKAHENTGNKPGHVYLEPRLVVTTEDKYCDIVKVVKLFARQFSAKCSCHIPSVDDP